MMQKLGDIVSERALAAFAGRAREVEALLQLFEQGGPLALYVHGVRAALDSVNEASSRPNPPITTPLDDCPSGRARIVPRAGVCASDSLSITRVDNAEAVPLRVFHDDVVSVCRSTSPIHLTSA